MNLNNNEKHWLVVGLALVKVLVPNVRSLLDDELRKLYETLKADPRKIHDQSPGNFLPKCVTSNTTFNYQFINGNHFLARGSPLNYRVKSHVDLAKLYLNKLYLTNFTAINDECDPSAALNLLVFVPVPSFIQRTRDRINKKAKRVRDEVRNCWAHCKLDEWSGEKLKACFTYMKELLVLCNLTNAAKELQTWEKNAVEELATSAAGDSVTREQVAELSTALKNWKSEEKEELEVIKATLKRIEEGIEALKRGQEKILQGVKRIEEKIEGQPRCIDITMNCLGHIFRCSCEPYATTQHVHHAQESSNENVIMREKIIDGIKENVKQNKDNGYLDYLKELGGKFCGIWDGSLIIKVECESLEILQRYWEECVSGRLNEMAEKCLVTQELLEKFGLETVKLQTTIPPAGYKSCRRELIAVELDIKDCHEFENVIEKIEGLIDINDDLPAALQLISDKKKEKHQGQESILEFLVDSGVDVDHKNKDGTFPLMIASYQGSDSLVQFLLDSGAEVNQTDLFGRTALHVASRCGHVDVVNLLVKHGASLDMDDKFGKTPLQLAKQKGNDSFEPLQILDEAKNDWESLSELHKAVQHDDVEEVISLVVDQSMNVNTVTNRNESALHWASVNGSADVVSALIELGSDLDLKDLAGRTPLHRAVEKNFGAITSLLLSNNANRQAVDNKGQTPLHLAAGKGHVEILEKLLASSSSDTLSQTNQQDNLGFTPLHRAAENNRITVVKKLIRAKADVNMQTKQNLSDRIYLVSGQCDGKETWMYLFVHKFKVALFKKIVKSGNVSEIDFLEFGQEILAGYGEKPNDDLRKFIENEASNFVLDNANETPLHLASRKGHNEIVQLLLEANGDVLRHDAEGFLPSHTAITYGNRETVKHLLKCSPSLARKPVQVCSPATNELKAMTPIDLAEANEVDMEDILKIHEEPTSSDAIAGKKPRSPEISTGVMKEVEPLKLFIEKAYATARKCGQHVFEVRDGNPWTKFYAHPAAAAC